MKVLLDEGVPHKLRRTLQESTAEHSFFTAQYVGLTGDSPGFKNLSPRQKDEKLLREAKIQEFDVVITVDKSMQIDQNNKTPIYVLTLDVGKENQQKFENIEPMLHDISKELSNIDLYIHQGIEPSFRTIEAINLEPQQITLQPGPPRSGLLSVKDMADQLMGVGREPAQAKPKEATPEVKHDPTPSIWPDYSKGMELRRKKPTGEDDS